MKNRIMKIVVCVSICVAIVTGCGKSNTTVVDKTGDGANKEDKYRIVCTTYPQYDWVKEIIGKESNRFELTLLLDDGVDLHSYQPTAADIAQISSADMFVYVGGESDGWVDDALAEATNKDMKVVNLLDTLGERVKEEELVEGMQGEAEETVTEDKSAEEEEEPEYDEHVWLSVKNAIILTQKLSETIQQIDKEHADEYAKQEQEYVAKLTDLDQRYEQVVENASIKTVLFGDRFPFRYLVDDYNLSYYAAFVGCSAESEASFETVTFLAGKLDELNLPAILVIENSDQKIAQTIKQNTKTQNQEILVMNSLQSVTNKDEEGGLTYLKVMEDNLKVLEKALTEK